MVDWSDKVADDFRTRIILDADNPILAFKANRDRYTPSSQRSYSGLPHLGSRASEDALTWNVFRSLQKAKKLDIITEHLAIGRPRGMLLWTLAPEPDETGARIQYMVGSVIRKHDGVVPGQVTEPDVIILGTEGIAVIECKLGEPSKAPSHLWEGSTGSVGKRLPTYMRVEPRLLRQGLWDNEVANVYQLVRMAFYALQFSEGVSVPPVVVSLVNDRNWNLQIRKLGRSAAELWDFFTHTLATPELRTQSTSWQRIRSLVSESSVGGVSDYLSSHPCLA